jgi:hypothetical protein
MVLLAVPVASLSCYVVKLPGIQMRHCFRSRVDLPTLCEPDLQTGCGSALRLTD